MAEREKIYVVVLVINPNLGNNKYNIFYYKNRRNTMGSDIFFVDKLGTNIVYGVFIYDNNKSIPIVGFKWEIGIRWNKSLVDLVDIDLDAGGIVEHLEVSRGKTKNIYNIVVIDSILVLRSIFSIGYLVILYKL